MCDAVKIGDLTPSHRKPESIGFAMGWLIGAVGFLIGSRPISDNSFLTHLATGRLIVSRNSIPVADPYSSAGSGQAWTVQSWLASTLYGVTESWLGIWAVPLIHGFVAAAISVTVWNLTKQAGSLLVRLGLMAMVVVMGAALWAPRPLMFGLLGLTVSLAIANRPVTKLGLALMAVCFGLWVNSHGSFVVGLGVLALITVGSAVDDREWPPKELGYLVSAIVGTGLGALHRLGPDLLAFPVRLLLRREALDGVQEWGPPQYTTWEEYLYLCVVIVLIVAVARGARWRIMLPATVMWVGGLVAVRNISAGCIVALLVAPGLAGLVKDSWGDTEPVVARVVQMLAVLVFGVAMWSTLSQPAIYLNKYPVVEVDWMHERGLIASPGVSVGHREYIGNYLTYRFGSDAHVFIDDRYDFHRLPAVRDHKAMVEGQGVVGVLENRKFDALLWPLDSYLSELMGLHPDWEVAYHGERFFVACRRSSPIYSRCLG